MNRDLREMDKLETYLKEHDVAYDRIAEGYLTSDEIIKRIEIQIGRKER